jgi:hypothetical protein
VTCDGFERWLDDGMPDAGAASAHDHAVRCARCATALAAALEVEQFLATPPTPAPAGFADRVMARVEASAAVRASLMAPPSSPAFEWWVRAAAEPAVALALGLAGLLVWKRDAFVAAFSGLLAIGGELVSGASRVAPSMTSFPMTSLPSIPMFSPAVSLGLAMVAAPALALVSLALYRWAERLAARTERTHRSWRLT